MKQAFGRASTKESKAGRYSCFKISAPQALRGAFAFCEELDDRGREDLSVFVDVTGNER